MSAGDVLYGYDIDGTLVPSRAPEAKSWGRSTGPERAERRIRYDAHCRNAPLLRLPQEPFVLVSGRPARCLEATWTWAREAGLSPRGVYLMGVARTRANMIAFKASRCQSLGVTTFFEDDAAIARALDALGVHVVRVEPLGTAWDATSPEGGTCRWNDGP